MPDLPQGDQDLTANSIRAKIDADTEAKLSSWFDNELDAYDLEAVRELGRKAI